MYVKQIYLIIGIKLYTSKYSQYGQRYSLYCCHDLNSVFLRLQENLELSTTSPTQIGLQL